VRPRRSLIGALLAALVVAATPAASANGQARARFDTQVFARVPAPGFPAHAYVHPDGRVYTGTYVNPRGDDRPSKVFEYTGVGTLLRSWTLTGQALSEDHGVQVATSDALGRLVLLDHTPARALLLDRATGDLLPYATFPSGSVPNYATWGADGSLYVTDYEQPIIWRIPPGGGTPRPWLSDPRLAGNGFGTTGIVLAPDQRTLLVTQQFAGDTPLVGALFAVAIGPGARPGELRRLWQSRPMDLADGVAVAASGRIYVALLGPNQIAVLDPQGHEQERFPETPVLGANGSPVPFDSLSSVAFLGTRLITASQSYLAGDPNNQVLHDVETGERGAPEVIPANAGLR
jgi:sugar lactone lactonase YvrE